tara:strand:+ start:505 stop:828 length:324 start_codon:yes stop_codon:yes gene_type:complete
MPHLDEANDVLYLPIPGVFDRSVAGMKQQLDIMMNEVLAPDRTVRRKSDGRVGRVVGQLAADVPVVTHVHGRPSPLGRHWGVALHDAKWMGMCRGPYFFGGKNGSIS